MKLEVTQLLYENSEDFPKTFKLSIGFYFFMFFKNLKFNSHFLCSALFHALHYWWLWSGATQAQTVFQPFSVRFWFHSLLFGGWYLPLKTSISRCWNLTLLQSLWIICYYICFSGTNYLKNMWQCVLDVCSCLRKIMIFKNITCFSIIWR